MKNDLLDACENILHGYIYIYIYIITTISLILIDNNLIVKSDIDKLDQVEEIIIC
jgi:hypothetical protein